MNQFFGKNKYLLLLLFLILFNVGLSLQLYFLKKEEKLKIKDISEISEVISFQGSQKEKKFLETKPSYQIQIYYPVTESSFVNQLIKEKVEKYKRDFKKGIPTIKIQSQNLYTLNIVYHEYCYQDKVSYVFTIFQDTGGAHPNTFYDSISYDVKTNQVIDIESLVKENSNFLEIVSKNVREVLYKNPRITNYGMMLEGTKPQLDNFSTFAFTDRGYLFFFSPYQVAPYSSGSFQVIVPYTLF